MTKGEVVFTIIVLLAGFFLVGSSTQEIIIGGL